MNSATNVQPAAGHGKRVGADAEPPVVVGVLVVLPELVVVDDDRRLLLEDDLPAFHRGTR